MKARSQAFIGIDGGGSKTRALAIDASGRPIDLNTGSGCNPHNIGFTEAGDCIHSALVPVLASIESSGSTLAAVFCGIAGIRSPKEQDAMRESLSRFSWARDASLLIDHDLSIAYEAALGERSGICLIAGTGAACIAKNESGGFHTSSNRATDGTEPGSGYGVGYDAIKAGIATIESETRDAVSEIAKSVIRLSEDGDSVAQEILNANARSLFQLVEKVHIKANLGEAFPIVITGGLGSAETSYRTQIIEQISARFPRSKFFTPRMSPVEAAADLALRQSKTP